MKITNERKAALESIESDLAVIRERCESLSKKLYDFAKQFSPSKTESLLWLGGLLAEQLGNNVQGVSLAITYACEEDY